MSIGRDALLGIKLVWRERHAQDVKILLFALALATFCMAFLNLLNASAWESVYGKARTTFGADLIIESHLPIPDPLQQEAKRRALSFAHVTTLLSMASSENKFQLASLKAVDDHYPLQGRLTVSKGQTTEQVSHGPKRGHLWVEPALLEALGVQLGEKLQLGKKSFVLEKLIIDEPEAANRFFTLAPRIFIHTEDLDETELLQPGSRAEYQLWLSGSESAITDYQKWINRLDNPNLEIESLQEGRSPIQRVLTYVQNYLGLIIFLIIMLGGLSISLCARAWVLRRMNAWSLYKVLGTTPNQLLRMMGLGLGFWGTLVIMVALSLSALGAFFSIQAVSVWLPDLKMAYRAWPLTLSAIIALLLLFGFTWPQIWLTKNILPIHILRARKLQPTPLWRFYILLALAGLGLLYIYIQNLHLTLIIAAGMGWAAFLAYLVLMFSIGMLTKLPRIHLPFSLALKQLSHKKHDGAVQLVSLTLLMTVLLVVYGLRYDFLDRWRTQLPEDTPNVFLVNVAPFEREDLTSQIASITNQNVTFYPIVRGRLTQIKGEKVRSNTNPQGPEGVDRPLNLTWMKKLPEHNEVIAGKAWRGDLKNQALISIESGFAERIGVTLGDTLTLSIQNESVQAQIYNIREVTWQSFQPNFFIIYPEGLIDQFASTYMGSFYLSPQQQSDLRALLKNYPEVTVINTDKIIQDIKSLMDLFIQGIELLLWVVFVFALMILYVVLMSALPDRKKQSALLKLVGASRRLIQISTGYEYVLLGFLAGVVASIGSIWIEYELAHRIFDLSFEVSWSRYGIMIILSTVGLGGLGLFGNRSAHTQPPLYLLRAH